jgi:hypothetical protein
MPPMQSKTYRQPVTVPANRKTFVGGLKSYTYDTVQVVPHAVHDPSAYQHRRYPVEIVPLPDPAPAAIDPDVVAETISKGTAKPVAKPQKPVAGSRKRSGR